MKFPQLPIGARFEFQGKSYVKIGPLAAQAEDGSQRIIPRHAVLQPEGGAAPEVPAAPVRRLDEDRVLAAFERYHDACVKALNQACTDLERRGAFQAALDAAHRDFLAALKP